VALISVKARYETYIHNHREHSASFEHHNPSTAKAASRCRNDRVPCSAYRGAKKAAAGTKSNEMGKALARSLWQLHFNSTSTEYFHNCITGHVVKVP
jgi:hypothetical protein